MIDQKKSKRVLISAILLLLLLLLAVGLFSPDEPEAPDRSDASLSFVPTGKPLTHHEPAATQEPVSSATSSARAPEPLCLDLAEKFHLKPGETAVISFLKEPGMNGVLMVTPEMYSEGNIAMNCRVLEVSDKAVETMAAEHLFPDIFSIDHSDVLDPLQLTVFLDAVRSTEGTDNTITPRMITKPGTKATWRSVITNPDGNWRGWKFGTTAELLDDGGFDLSLEYNWQGDSA